MRFSFTSYCIALTVFLTVWHPLHNQLSAESLPKEVIELDNSWWYTPIGNLLYFAGLKNAPPEVQVQAAMMRQLVKLSKGKKGSGSENSEEGQGRGFKGVRRLRHRYKRRPQKLLNGYRERVTEALGIRDPRQYWTYTDYSRRLQSSSGKSDDEKSEEDDEKGEEDSGESFRAPKEKRQPKRRKEKDKEVDG